MEKKSNICGCQQRQMDRQQDDRTFQRNEAIKNIYQKNYQDENLIDSLAKQKQKKDLEARQKERDGTRIGAGSRHEGPKTTGGSQFRIETRFFLRTVNSTTVNKSICIQNSLEKHPTPSSANPYNSIIRPSFYSCFLSRALCGGPLCRVCGESTGPNTPVE